MEYPYATLLLYESGEELNEENITRVLEAARVSVDESRVKALVAALEDVSIEDEIQPALDAVLNEDNGQQTSAQASSIEGEEAPRVEGESPSAITEGPDTEESGDSDSEADDGGESGFEALDGSTADEDDYEEEDDEEDEDDSIGFADEDEEEEEGGLDDIGTEIEEDEEEDDHDDEDDEDDDSGTDWL